jgi:hypothetical protein
MKMKESDDNDNDKHIVQLASIDLTSHCTSAKFLGKIHSKQELHLCTLANSKMWAPLWKYRDSVAKKLLQALGYHTFFTSLHLVHCASFYSLAICLRHTPA